jgi:pimeloyl-ACP methyl ester carboxylesterase
MNTVTYPSRSPRHAVELSEHVVLDRGSDEAALTLTCRWPKESKPVGFIVYCHGLGSSGRDYAELGEFWAAHGYFVVQPTFPDWIGFIAASEPQLGLDPAAEDLANWAMNPQVKSHMFRLLHLPSHWIARVKIAQRVLDQMDFIMESTCNLPSPKIPCAAAGHSFGAYTSQLLAGATIDVPGQGPTRYHDLRVKAAVLLSAQGRDQQGLRDGSWDTVACPMMNITGTLDKGAKGQGHLWKSEPYEFAPPGDKYLAVFKNADHYLGGITRTGLRPDNADQRKAIAQLTLAFWDAQLQDDPDAKSWLASISTQIGNCPVTFAHK